MDQKTKKIFENKCKYIKKNEIQEEDKFFFEFNEFLRKNKIKISIFGYKIIWIIKKESNMIQKNKYMEILKEYFRKIRIVNLEDILLKEKDTAKLNINDSYIEYYYWKKNNIQYRQVDTVLFDNKEFKAIKFLLLNVYHPKKLILFGNSTKIPRLTTKINKELGIFCTYEEDYKYHVLNNTQKK